MTDGLNNEHKVCYLSHGLNNGPSVKWPIGDPTGMAQTSSVLGYPLYSTESDLYALALRGLGNIYK